MSGYAKKNKLSCAFSLYNCIILSPHFHVQQSLSVKKNIKGESIPLAKSTDPVQSMILPTAILRMSLLSFCYHFRCCMDNLVLRVLIWCIEKFREPGDKIWLSCLAFLHINHSFEKPLLYINLNLFSWSWNCCESWRNGGKICLSHVRSTEQIWS